MTPHERVQRAAVLAFHNVGHGVEHSIEEPAAGLRVKPPKTSNGRRAVNRPGSAFFVPREHLRRQLELRVQLGMGWRAGTILSFRHRPTLLRRRGRPNLSRDWRRTATAPKLLRSIFHALRHSHASALIAARLDVLGISRRLGHGASGFTLGVYGTCDAATGESKRHSIRIEPLVQIGSNFGACSLLFLGTRIDLPAANY